MNKKPRILAFAGSLRKGSYNKMMVRVAAEGARRAGAEVTVINLDDFPLPLFDEDLEARDGLPDEARKLKGLFKDHDGLLIASPEYNSSLSAALKNAIDWVSRKEGDEAPLACFKGKVAVIMSASPGALGGLRGLVHLRAILGNINVLVLPDQRAIVRAHEAFAADGTLKDDKERAAVEGLGTRLAGTLPKLLV